ncbi:MAG: DNA polymerase III subunit delta [bacterium]|nr:DNA polymerase III subunit delta [bacterium]
MTVYFFYGDEDYNIEAEISKMKKKLNPDFISMSWHILDNPNYTDLISALRTPPMMFGDMLYVINIEKYFKDSKKEDSNNVENEKSGCKLSDAELADVEDALNNNPNGLDIIFVVKLPRNEKKKLDSRRKLYKLLTKFNTKEFPTLKTYKYEDIAGWIKQKAKEKEISVENDAVKLLFEQLGNDLRQLNTELEKLKLLAYPNNTITKKMVSDLSISNQDLFNLTDFIMKNRKDEALLEFRRLIDKKYPLEILAALQTMLRKWILIKLKYKTSQTQELVKLTYLQDFQIKDIFIKLKNINASDLVKLRNNLTEAEYNIKSGNATDITKEIEFALIR